MSEYEKGIQTALEHVDRMLINAMSNPDIDSLSPRMVLQVLRASLLSD